MILKVPPEDLVLSSTQVNAIGFVMCISDPYWPVFIQDVLILELISLGLGKQSRMSNVALTNGPAGFSDINNITCAYDSRYGLLRAHYIDDILLLVS